MNELSVFTYSDKPVRTAMKDGEVWFVAKDVCDVLDIRDTWNAIQRLPESMKGTDTISTPGGKQQMAIINEAGIYKLAFTSRKPEAEKFTDWVAQEVIPSIRKHGAYMTAETIEKTLNDPDFIIGLATKLKEQQAEIAAKNQQIKLLEPKAEFFDAVVDSKDAVSIGEVAKLLGIRGIGRNNLFSILRERKILDDRNVPYQAFVDRGYFRVIE